MEFPREWLDVLQAQRGVAVALVVALAAALVGRGLGRPWLAGAAAGIGILAGWWSVLGLVTATPRQLPERLPLLMLVLVLAMPLIGRVARRWSWAALPGALLGAGWVGWWMAGAPLVVPDLVRALPVLAGLGVTTLLLALRAAPRWAVPVAAMALLAGLLAAAAPGPQLVLGGSLCAAALGAGVVPPRAGRSAPPAALWALPAAGAMAALAAIPVIARGAPADWAALSAPLAALALGAPAGARLGRRGRSRFGAPLGAVLAGGCCALAAWLMR